MDALSTVQIIADSLLGSSSERDHLLGNYTTYKETVNTDWS